MDAEGLRSALNAREYSSLELGEMELAVRQGSLAQAEKDELLQLLDSKRSLPQTTLRGSSGRAAMQDWIYFPACLTQELWDKLMGQSDRIHVIQ